MSPNDRPYGPLDGAVTQLWGRALEGGGYRVSQERMPGRGWRRLRTFTIIGPPGRPSLLVERGPHRAVSRSLVAYRKLRTWRPSAARLALAAAARAHLPLPWPALHLDARYGVDTTETEPLAAMEHALRQPLLAHLGVRTGANAKATAQLFSLDGSPAGYAKTAWNELSKQFVRTETHRLRERAGRAGRFYVPRLTATGDVLGMPFAIIEPLPHDVRRLRGTDDLTLADLCTLSPIVRVAPTRTTGHLVRLTERLKARQLHPLLTRVSGPLIDLAHRLAGTELPIPIAAFDHGDLVPWNASRDPGGRVWLWDWELSEADIVAGMDAVHWFVHARHGPAPQPLATAVADAGERAAGVHRALGMSLDASRLVTASYALSLADRACSLALAHEGWHRNRITEDAVLELAALGRQLLRRSTTRTGPEILPLT